MGLFSALFAGVNGINSNGNVISVIGDNIANVNTIGYKGSRAQFEDVMAGSSNTGLGSRVAAVTPQFSQGGFESTSSVTDMAVDGKGFFVLKSSTDSSTYFSRAGQFVINKDGYLVNSDGLRVQGYTLDSSSNVTSSTGNISISTAPVAPKKTSSLSLDMNLNSNATTPAAFSLADPTTTSNFSAGVTVYDSLGNSHLTTVYFRKSASNTWQYRAVVDGGEITGGTAGTPVLCQSGELVFGTTGTLTSNTNSSNDYDFLGATQSQTITFDLGTGTGAGGTGTDGVTQYGSASSITNSSQNGYASGSLKSLTVDADGSISGNYTNGTTQLITKVVLASFTNENALTRVGSNNYIETLSSGAPLLSAPGAGGKGTVVSSTLEQSNVDLANELIKMVIIQRGFQANSRTIGTVNDLLAQLVTLGQ